MSEDRDLDKKVKLIPSQGTGKTHQAVSVDVVKSAYIAEGLSVHEIAERHHLPIDMVRRVAEEHNLPELRKAYMREGLAKIQNVQIDQANRLMDLELNFKKLRLVQLENKLQDYMTYYARHGDFYKRHPKTGEILRDTDGMPLQLHVPSVAREINQIKESVTLSEGLKKLLVQIDDIINPPTDNGIDDDNVVDLGDIDQFFSKKV